MTQPHSTVRRKAAPDKVTNKLKSFQNLFGAVPSESDIEIAKRLIAIWKDKRFPKMVRASLFQIFWDTLKHYHALGFLKKDFTKTWLPLWAVVVARLNRSGEAPTHITYTWSQSDEDEAESDAEDEEETSARMMFNFCNSSELAGENVDHIREAVAHILERATPLTDFEVFKVAWPRALAGLVQNVNQNGE